ncbi:MAG: hypothetical protein AB1791_04945 [Chloroflexota bacterium]
MKKVLWVLSLISVLLLAACTSAETGTSSANAEVAAGEQARLNDDYNDALSVQGQLALGTVQLEETELAVDEAQAAELLPLWQALQSLGASDTAATVEIEAVVNQIQDTMTPAQIQAIADMKLTADSLTELMESGALAGGFGRVASQSEGSSSTTADGFPAGGPPGGGFLAGGPPAGGLAAGGPPGGFAGGAAGNVSEDDIATRQAAIESGDLGDFQERALTGMVIRLLAEKTGTEIANPGQEMANAVFTAVSEATGLSLEELQAQTAEGTTLAAIIEANGGDVDEARAAVITALEALPNAADMDVEQAADSWLGLAP